MGRDPSELQAVPTMIAAVREVQFGPASRLNAVLKQLKGVGLIIREHHLATNTNGSTQLAAFP